MQQSTMFDVTKPTTVLFNRSNAPNGWLSMHSPYGYTYNDTNWQSIAQAWYTIVHGVHNAKYVQGHYSTINTDMSDDDKYTHLLNIMQIIVSTHTILQSYLLNTGHTRIIYTVSKFASDDDKWLGHDFETHVGGNNLGLAWMETRSRLLGVDTINYLCDSNK